VWLFFFCVIVFLLCDCFRAPVTPCTTFSTPILSSTRLCHLRNTQSFSFCLQTRHHLPKWVTSRLEWFIVWNFETVTRRCRFSPRPSRPAVNGRTVLLEKASVSSATSLSSLILPLRLLVTCDSEHGVVCLCTTLHAFAAKHSCCTDCVIKWKKKCLSWRV
jgi:hypothetical protein